MADAPRFADRGLLLLLLGIPTAVFALVFVGSLAYFRLTDEPTANPEPRPVGRELLRPPAGQGRLVLTLSAETEEPAESYLVSISLDGSDVRPITAPPPEGGLASDGYPAPAPDGGTIAFKRATASPTGSTEPHVYLVGVDGSSLRRLTSGGAAEFNPAWSPDGKRIAFARAVGRRFDLFVCGSDGSGLKRLTKTPTADEDFPAWSPDGTRLVFARYDGGFEQGTGDLWLVDDDGSHETLLLGGPGDHSQATWSPDGGQIAFVEEGHIAVMNADGTDVRPLTEGGPMDFRPAWSADGSRLVFTRDPGTILVIDVDSSQLFKVPLDAPASEAVWVSSP
jgi:TolB protein